MTDAAFADPRLAGIYDALDPDRDDLDAYLALAAELGSRSLLDIGCGTGTFAVMAAGRGLEVVALDPAGASVDVARRKPGADDVRWVVGDVGALPDLQVDLVTMTGNVAQVFVTDDEWSTVLRASYDALRPGRHLVLETRDPAQRAWLTWNRDASYRRTTIPDVGDVESWVELLTADGAIVTFRWTFAFHSDGGVLTSDSTLRFRDRAEVANSLHAAGLVAVDVRGAPDRPGKELVFVARRPASATR